MSKKKLVSIRNSIIEEFKEIGIMPFIEKEVEYNLHYLNYYKLKNIQDNIELFVKKISKLNQNYCISLEK